MASDQHPPGNEGSDALLRLMAEQIPGVMWTTDTELRFTSSLGAGLNELHLAPGEVVGMSLFEYFRTDDPDWPPIAAHRRALEGESVDYEQSWEDRNFQVHVRPLADASGRTLGCVGVAYDVTERKQAEESLRRSEERYFTLVETTSDWIWEVDADGVYTYASRKVTDLLGYEPQEVLGRTPFDFMPPEEAQRVGRIFRDIVESRRSFETLENVNLHKDGRKVVLETSGVPIFDSEGTLVGYRGIDRDITARKRAEEALKRAHEELEHRVEERTAELTRANRRLKREIAIRKTAEEALRNEHRVLRGLLKAHDRDRQLIAYEIHDGLCQRLVAALMHFETIDRSGPSSTDRAERDYADGMEALRECLAEARLLISGVRPPLLDESGVVAAVQNLIYESSRPGGPEIEFRKQVAFERLEPVLENCIYRIVQEALANALRHSRSDRIRVALWAQEDRVCIAVEDWGVGFRPEDVPADRFGISGICERARLLGGTATVESSPGGGTRVTVEMPLSIDAAE